MEMIAGTEERQQNIIVVNEAKIVPAQKAIEIILSRHNLKEKLSSQKIFLQNSFISVKWWRR